MQCAGTSQRGLTVRLYAMATNPTWTCALHHAADAPRSKRKRDLCEDCYAWLEASGLAWCSKGHRVACADMAPGKSWCRACDAARSRKYVEANQRRNERRKGARAAVPRIYDAAQRRRYYLKHRSKELTRARRYYQAHRAAVQARNKAWRLVNRDHMRAYRRTRYITEKLQAWKRAA